MQIAPGLTTCLKKKNPAKSVPRTAVDAAIRAIVFRG